jgi:hypothetical protein
MRVKHYTRYVSTCPHGFKCKSPCNTLRKVDTRRIVRRKNKQELKNGQ